MVNNEMRKVLCEELERLMSLDNRIVVIDADLAKPNGTFPLREKFPDRAFEVGIAEQNMAGIAAGMAAYGCIPFIASFTPFVSRRICDQIAISIAYAKQNVKIIGTAPGIAAQLNGGTHMSMEDIGVMRSIPDIVIYEPVDIIQLKKSLPKIIEYDGPIYIRLFRKTTPIIFPENYEFDLLKGDYIRKGKDVTLFATGIMVAEAVDAAEKLKDEGIEAEVINIHTIKPIDTKIIIESVKKTGAVVTCENHNVMGGLKSAVAEVLVEEYPVALKGIGIQDHFGEVGDLAFLKEKYHMTSNDIVKAAKGVINKKLF